MVERRVLLVVDGDADRRVDLARLLASTPHVVVHAADPSDGLIRFFETKPDLVFLAQATCGTGGGELMGQISAKLEEGRGLAYLLGDAVPEFASSTLPLPLSRDAVDRALMDLATHRARAFAAASMELDLDAFPSRDAVPTLETPATKEGERVPTQEMAAPGDIAATAASDQASQETGPTAPQEEPATAAAPAEDEPMAAGPPVDEPTMMGGPEDLEIAAAEAAAAEAAAVEAAAAEAAAAEAAAAEAAAAEAAAAEAAAAEAAAAEAAAAEAAEAVEAAAAEAAAAEAAAREAEATARAAAETAETSMSARLAAEAQAAREAGQADTARITAQEHSDAVAKAAKETAARNAQSKAALAAALALQSRRDTLEIPVATATIPTSLQDATQALDADGDAPAEDSEPTPPEGTPASLIQDALAASSAPDTTAELPPAPPPVDPPSQETAEFVDPSASADTAEAQAVPTDAAARTGVEEAPKGLKEVLAAADAAPEHTGVGIAPEGTPAILDRPVDEPSGDDVFATKPGAPAAAPPASMSMAVPVVAPPEPPSRRSDETLAPLPVPERAPQAPGVPMPRVVKLDGAPVPKELEASSSERAQNNRGGFRVVDDGVLGPEPTARILALYAGLEGGSLYRVLGLDKRATSLEITAAFHKAALEYHPDRWLQLPAGPLKDALRAVFGRCAEAIRVLGDPAQRSAYDQALLASEPAPPSAVSMSMARAPQDLLPSVIIEDMPTSGSVRPAAAAAPPVPVKIPSGGASMARNMGGSMARPPPPPPTPRGSTSMAAAPPPAAPSSSAASAPAADALTEDAAATPGGKKFLRLAIQALGRNDLNGARLNLTFALGYEPDNGTLKKRLQEIEARMARPGARG